MSSCIRRVGSILGSMLVLGSAAFAQTALLHINGSVAGETYGERLEQVAIGFSFAPNYIALVGVPDDNTNGVGAGRIDVRRATTGELLYSAYGHAAGDHFGIGVAKGDVNGDGRPDYLFVGADQSGNGGPGYVEIVDPFTGIFFQHVDGAVAGARFGASIEMLGDFDGDGVNEYAVGAPDEDDGAVVQAGAVHILSGVNNAELEVVRGGSTGAHCGAVIHALGDVDGDTIDDFAVGAPGDLGMGSVTVYSETRPPAMIWTAPGVNPNEDFGAVIEVLKDVDGDLIDDILVGAPAIDDASLPGRVALLSGATGLQVVDVAGNAPGDQFGVALQVGDFEGDGVRDVYVGAPGVDGAGVDRGAVVIYSLTAPGVFTFNNTLDGGADGDAFGSATAILPIAAKPIAGDYLAVGVPGFDGGGTDRGQMVVYSTTTSPASSQNYGAGWPGTLGIPTLTVNNPPQFETIMTISVQNSAGIATPALLLLGFVRATIPTHAGGDILIAPPWIITPVGLPVGQLDLTQPVPTDVRYCGLTFDLQALELDFGASRHISFTPGLEMTLGG
jgi:hypothetical protein